MAPLFVFGVLKYKNMISKKDFKRISEYLWEIPKSFKTYEIYKP